MNSLIFKTQNAKQLRIVFRGVAVFLFISKY